MNKVGNWVVRKAGLLRSFLSVTPWGFWSCLWSAEEEWATGDHMPDIHRQAWKDGPHFYPHPFIQNSIAFLTQYQLFKEGWEMQSSCKSRRKGKWFDPQLTTPHLHLLHT